MSGILLSIRTLAEYTRARSCNCTATTDKDSAECVFFNGTSTAQVSSCAWFHLGQGHTLFQLICQPIGLPIPRVVLTPARDAHRGAAQPLLVPTSKCSSNALALGLGLGLGLGLPLLLAILVYSYWFYSRRAKPQDRAAARSQGGTSQV